MTADKPSLTEELNSSLRAAALRAPAPTETVSRVLARTVGSAPFAAGSPAPEADVAGSTASHGRRVRWARRPSRSRLVWAAGAAAAVLAVVGVAEGLSRVNTSSSTTSAASAPSADSVAAGSAESGIAGGRTFAPQVKGSDASSGPAVTPDQNPGPLPMITVPDCKIGETGTVTGISATTHDAPMLAVTYCLGADGVQGSNTLAVYRLDASGAERVALTIISSQEGLQDVRYTVSGSTLTVHATTWAATSGPERGAAITRTYTVTPDRTAVRLVSSRLTTAACAAGSVSVQVVPGPESVTAFGTRHPTTVTVVMRNTGAAGCLVEGYPELSAVGEPASRHAPTARVVPLTVVPGQTVSATVLTGYSTTPQAASAPCSPALRWTVTVPSGASFSSGYEFSGCGLVARAFTAPGR